MENELRAHEENNTWTLVKKQEDMKIIDSKWVFKIVREKTSDKPRYKTKQCVRCFCQQYGIDYNETFAPVIRYDLLRVFLAPVTQNDLELLQLDVCTESLHGELEKQIFMEMPERLSNRRDTASVVFRLNESLYGLKLFLLTILNGGKVLGSIQQPLDFSLQSRNCNFLFIYIFFAFCN